MSGLIPSRVEAMAVPDSSSSLCEINISEGLKLHVNRFLTFRKCQFRLWNKSIFKERKMRYRFYRLQTVKRCQPYVPIFLAGNVSVFGNMANKNNRGWFLWQLISSAVVSRIWDILPAVDSI
jgi:hypothetical protein